MTEDEQNSETFEEGLGWFLVDRRGSYARRFLMDEEDFKIKFKKWMRSNLRKLTVDLAVEYLNTKLLKKISEETLLAHRISLPISRDTSWQWMQNCDAMRMGSQKTYYNDHHENPEVIVYRINYIKILRKLQMRMKVWRIISEQEEEKYKTMRQWASFESAMPVGEEVIIDGVQKFVHHMDDQEKWSKDPVFHPSFEPGNKQTEDKWTCSFNHSYLKCKCHLELREYGQDESVYHSGDHPATRWGVDHRSYAISKSKGISRMASMFKD